MAIEESLDFRKVVDKTAPHDISGEILNIRDKKAYLLEAIEYSDGSYAPVTIFDCNNNELSQGNDYVLTEDAALITFQDSYQPVATPYRANYRGVGSIIWAHDVRELQDVVTDINNSALNKNGDTLQGPLNVNNNNILNVNTINDIPLWTHNHANGQGSLIPASGLENNAVTTAKIADSNVTDNKIDTMSRSKLVGALSTDVDLQNALNNKLNITGGTVTGVITSTVTNVGGNNPIAPFTSKMSNIEAGTYPSDNIYPYVIKITDGSNTTLGSFEYSYQTDRYGVGIVCKKWGEYDYSYLKVGWKDDGEMYFEFPKCSTRPTSTSTAAWDRVVVIVENYANGTSWYRVYSDGWVEQGGQVTIGTDSSYTVTFANFGLKNMKDTNYSISLSIGINANASSGARGGPIWYRPDTKATTGFKIINDLSDGPIDFVVRGLKA